MKEKENQESTRVTTRDFLLVELVTYIGDLELVNLLQMLREDLDELMRRNVFNSVYVFVDQSKVLLHSIDSVRHSVDRLTSIFLLDYTIFIK